MKQFSIFRSGAIAALAVCTIFAPVSRADDWNKKTIITVNNPLEVPGATLQPGKYVIKLFNSNAERHLVQIMNEREDKLVALTFTVAAQRLDPSDKTILSLYEGSNGQPEALRMWFYPGDTIGQEFLYPHDQALRISQRTNKKVREATDTESAAITSKDVDYRPAKEDVDSASVTLKTDSDRTAAQEPVMVAQAEPAPSPQPMVAQAQETPAPVQSYQSQTAAPEPVASTLPESLPQTAGEGPLAALIGTLSLAAAFTLWTARRRREQ